MEITEVRIKLTEDTDDRLQAFCSITFDDAFVVRDLKIIEGTNGPFVAMPSRKLTTHCPRCRSKNHLRANYCNQCGAKVTSDLGTRDAEGRAKLYADIAHPINSVCREMIQERVIEAYRTERELAQRPGYVSRYEEDYDDGFVGGDVEDLSVTHPEAANFPQIEIQPSQPAIRPPHTSTGSQLPSQRETPHSGPRHVRKGFGSGILDD